MLDATTGQNALVQAKEFSDVAKISGIVLTKMDGTAKGRNCGGNSGGTWSAGQIYRRGRDH